VSHLCAFLCLAVQWEPFPLASFAPFSSHNSQSAFTDIVKDHLVMHLDVLLIICKPSPLVEGRQVKGSFTTWQIIVWMTWQWLTTNLKRQLGNRKLGIVACVAHFLWGGHLQSIGSQSCC
jgi:hypothetical protein